MVAFSPLIVSEAGAHSGHGSQPPGIIDPLVTHHAVLEDELKLNYFGSRFDEEGVETHAGSLEIAYAFTDLFGFELFLPFGANLADGTWRGGLGDIEVQVPKVSFLREEGLVLTTYLAVTFPTSRDETDLGEGTFVFAPHLLLDAAHESFGVQANAAVEIDVHGDVALEGNLSTAYAIVLDEDSPIHLAPLLELNLEAPIRPTAAPLVALTPGVKLAFFGWHVGLGVQLPIGRKKEFDFRGLVQVGYHVTWESLFTGD